MSDAKPMIFLVDDEQSVLDALTVLVHRNLGYRARTFSDAESVLDAIRETRPDVLITDINIDGREAGIEVLERAREMWPGLPVILLTAVGTREAAIRAVNAGAYYFLEKPFRNDHLAHLIRTAAEQGSARSRARSAAGLGRHARSRRHNHPGALEERARSSRPNLVGNSVAFLEAVALVEQAATTDVTVLLTGESGVGKGVLAAYLHEISSRAARPFLSVNCGALAETLLESQLFGHVRGAFTGADKDQPGLVRAADGGTLFLDEVSELASATQVKLLRVLQEREVIPVGGVEPFAVDVRFVAATNRDLRRDVAQGRFREDLFWRLNVMAIEVPSLRERREDIPLLARHALDRVRRRDPQVMARGIADDAMALLEQYDWPGNIRELENAIERAAVVSTGDLIRAKDLPTDVFRPLKRDPPRSGMVFEHIHPTLAEIERVYVEWSVQRHGGDVDCAAQALGIPPAAVRAILGASKLP